ncbi:MAG TPA: tripartite tricarboxylate transporter substrate binding protein [Ramlibacter sp.]|jgi:tripartite-type tricarboxylate transporter receptor subunit TctC|uniref:Bug family tripartite tricarboxylate transporter substrate binding protein n=1 Tax=Ramlibacter sp. TaxID=1917967 RepID=UPI002D2F1B7A|nr:tripartite tricarboxylate transporter substrate binding protein [Ramlibacter sp.]HZY17300.1 tripartite tricarboxylate transporter substrate binding protein [Ramlibacter sp.]
MPIHPTARLLRAASGWLAGATLAAAAAAQGADWPTRPVRVVVAFSAGGTTDILARSVSQKLAERFKQSFVVDNKPGGGGNIGTEMAARAAPDGHTLIVNSVGPMAVNATLYRKLNIDPLTDLVPVVQIADVPNVLVVHPSVPAATLEEFIAHAKANPGRLNYGSTGVGTSSHLSGYMLSQRSGVQTTHVPYRGADALNDLLAGRVQFMFATIPSVIQHIQAGKLRALAVSSAQRSRSLPDVPTVADRGFPGFEAGSWFGFFAPRGTPETVVAQLNRAVNDVLPGLQAQMVREGADPVGGSPEQFRQFVRKEHDKWKVIVRESGATAD